MNFLTRILRLPQIRGTMLAAHRLHTERSLPLQWIPTLTQTQIANNPWIWQKNDHIELPVTRISKIDLPNGLPWSPFQDEPNTVDKIIEAPSTIESGIAKEAVRLIVIRRKKMKKHKLKKLRKRMKYEYAKRRQRRELKKEKLFQAELIQQCKEAEQFSAEKYVQERIDKLNEIVVPRYYKGKRLPEFLIRQLMGLPPK